MSEKQLVVSTTEPLDGEIIGPTGDRPPRTVEVKVRSENASGVEERLVDTAVPPKAPITIDLRGADQSGPPAAASSASQ
jgi:hypothetical protein